MTALEPAMPIDNTAQPPCPRTHCWRCGAEFGKHGHAPQSKSRPYFCQTCVTHGRAAFRRTTAEYHDDVEPGPCGYWEAPYKADVNTFGQHWQGRCELLPAENSPGPSCLCVYPSCKERCPIARMARAEYLVQYWTGAWSVMYWYQEDAALHG